MRHVSKFDYARIRPGRPTVELAGRLICMNKVNPSSTIERLPDWGPVASCRTHRIDSKTPRQNRVKRLISPPRRIVDLRQFCLANLLLLR